jgi:hypothetical protein
MQYMALIYSSPSSNPAYGSEAFTQMYTEYNAFTALLKKDGVFVAGDALQGTDKATSVRVRANKSETMDGPFAETKEHLGGYYLMECKDLDQALKYAAMIPTAKWGTVEVRPIVTM